MAITPSTDGRRKISPHFPSSSVTIGRLLGLLLEATNDQAISSPLILATGDGGATWQRADLLALKSIVDLSIVD